MTYAGDGMGGRRRLRVRGCLLAAACGQALGVPFERQAPATDDLFDTFARVDVPLRLTGDLVLTLAHAEHLASGSASGRPSAPVARSCANSWPPPTSSTTGSPPT